MKVFIWSHLSQVSDNYHSGGGVVVIAESLEEAISMANSEPGCCIGHQDKPSCVVECLEGEKQVFIFPNAGCC